MIGCNCIGDILHQNGLTRLGLGDYQRALTLADRREKVNNARGEIGCGRVSTEVELFVREEWGKALKRNAVSNLRGLAAVDGPDARQGEELLIIVGRTHETVYHIACF